MKISVAMCAYNGAPYVCQQLDSIAAQSRVPDELVICDDASTDKTRELVESFSGRASFPVRLYTSPHNLGSTKNFEKAVALCEGDVIALCDQDDVWMHEKLDRIEHIFSTSPDVGLVFTDAELIDEHSSPLGFNLKQFTLTPPGLELAKAGRTLELLLDHTAVTGATMAFRSKFRRVLPTPTGTYLIHDGWMALMIALLADVAFIDEPLIKYRQHPTQQLGIRPAISQPHLSRAEAFWFRAYYDLVIIRALNEVQETLGSMPDLPRAKASIQTVRARIDYLRAKVSHLQARADANARPGRLNRVPVVFKELRTFRYGLYSKGLLSAAKDLLA